MSNINVTHLGLDKITKNAQIFIKQNLKKQTNTESNWNFINTKSKKTLQHISKNLHQTKHLPSSNLRRLNMKIILWDADVSQYRTLLF